MIRTAHGKFRAKTFDPDDRIETAAIIIEHRADGFGLARLRLSLTCARKPSETPYFKMRGIYLGYSLADARPETLAECFENVARKIRLATRKRPKIRKKFKK